MRSTQQVFVTERKQSIVETIATILYGVAVYYVMRPDKKEQHEAILRAKLAQVAHWVSVQDTLAEIRSLPEREPSNKYQL